MLTQHQYIDPAKQRDTRIVVHPSQRQHHVEPISDPLYVVTAITNPRRYYSRYKLYQAFEKHMEDSGAILYTGEVAYGDRHHEITSPDNPRHIQLRSSTELFHKENILNLLMARLPADARYVGWIDADVSFVRPDWVQEAKHLLQHYHIIQGFSEAVDLGPNHEILLNHRGFMYAYCNGLGIKDGTYYAPNRGQRGGSLNHTGFVWLGRRDALEALGGLYDVSICGSADWSMAFALIGKEVLPGGASPGYKASLHEWKLRADKHIRRNVGYMDGLVHHAWHGKKSDRGYMTRNQILATSQYDPAVDLKRDFQGLWQLQDSGEDRSLLLRDNIRQMLAARNEDSIDIDEEFFKHP